MQGAVTQARRKRRKHEWNAMIDRSHYRISRTETAHPAGCLLLALRKDIANILRLEDAGASAVVLHSLFEEQITRREAAHLDRYLTEDRR